MELQLTIHDFEGPLDLLLHLVKINKMDIMDIEIDSISKQYMDYLNLQERLNLEVASEYVVLGSELLEIKSKMLLPKRQDDEELEEDPRSELMERLMEYDTYKKVCEILKKQEEKRREIYTKQPENIMQYKDQDSFTAMEEEYDLQDLMDAFQKFLERKIEDRPLKTSVTVNEISVSSRRHDIRRILKEKKKVSFYELFSVVTKEYVVATFLAILEMAKKNEISIVQKKNFDEIILEAQ